MNRINIVPPKNKFTRGTISSANKYKALFNDNDDDDIERPVTVLDMNDPPKWFTNPEQFIYPDTGATNTCVSRKTKLINEVENANDPLNIGSCSNHTLISKSKGKLPLPLPQKATIAHKFEDMTVNLLSVGRTCDQGCVGVFRENDMFISKEEDIDITLQNDPLVTGVRNGNNDL